MTTLTLKKSENWKGKFTNLDKYKNGKEIVYTIKEAKVEGYESKIEGNERYFFQNSKKFTGEYQNKYFVNGKYANGVYNGTLYKNGDISTKVDKRDLNVI